MRINFPVDRLARINFPFLILARAGLVGRACFFGLNVFGAPDQLISAGGFLPVLGLMGKNKVG